MSNDLNDLQKKLNQFRASEQKIHATPGGDPAAEAQNMSTGIRAGTEFIASILAGGGIGWLIDSWAHSRPWGLIIFLFLGVGAGFMSIYRITNNMGSAVGFAALQNKAKADIKPPENAGADGDDDA
jgi:ATP synthase protein I